MYTTTSFSHPSEKEKREGYPTLIEVQKDKSKATPITNHDRSSSHRQNTFFTRNCIIIQLSTYRIYINNNRSPLKKGKNFEESHKK